MRCISPIPQSTGILPPIERNENMDFIKDVIKDVIKDGIKDFTHKTNSNIHNIQSNKGKRLIFYIFIVVYIFMLLDSPLSTSLFNFSIWTYINKSLFISNNIIKINATLHYIFVPKDKITVSSFLLFLSIIYLILSVFKSLFKKYIIFFSLLCDIELSLPRIIAIISVFYCLYFCNSLSTLSFPLPTICTTIALISDIFTIAKYKIELEKKNLQKIKKELQEGTKCKPQVDCVPT